MENYDTYEDLLDTSRNSSGTAEKKYQSYQESYEAAKNELTAALEDFANSSQINKILIDLTNMGTQLVEFIQKLVPYLPALISSIENFKALSGRSLIQRAVGRIGNNLQKYNYIDNYKKIGGTVKDQATGFVRSVDASGKLNAAEQDYDVKYAAAKEAQEKFAHADNELKSAQGEANEYGFTNSADAEQIIKNKERAAKAAQTKADNAKMAARNAQNSEDQVAAENAARLAQNKADNAKLTLSDVKGRRDRLKAAEDKYSSTKKDSEEKTKVAQEAKAAKEKARLEKESLKDTKTKIKAENKANEQAVEAAKEQADSAQEGQEAGKKTADSKKEEVKVENQIVNDKTQEKNSSGQVKADMQNGAQSSEDIKQDLQQGSDATNNAENNGTGTSTAAGAQVANAATGGTVSTPTVNKGQALLTGISILANTAMASFSQFATAATTHSYNGESVESSEEAQKAGGGVSAILSWVPLVGSYIGPKIGEAVAAAIDKDRDAANATTQRANDRLDAYQSIGSSLSDLQEAQRSGDKTELKETLESFTQDIYSADNEETRRTLEQYLGNSGGKYSTIYEVLEAIDGNTEDSAEAIRELKVAQIEAQKAEIGNKYASQIYNSSVDRKEAYETYANSVNEGSINGTGAGVAAGLGATATGALLGVGAGAAAGGIAVAGSAALASTLGIVGVANAWNPIGWCIGIGAVLGTIAGVVGGIYAGEEAANAAEEEQYEKSTYASMTASEKLTYANKAVQAAIDNQAAADAAYAADASKANQDLVDDAEAQLEAAEALLEETKESNSLINQMLGELDELTEEEAFVKTSVNTGDKTSYISDMSIAELNNVGIDAIVEAYAKQIQAQGGLETVELFDKDGNLTEAGYDYAYSALKDQDDSEITSVLNGESYTLNQALQLDSSQRSVQKVLKNFANALGTGVDSLDDFAQKVGELTLSDMFLSTSEITEQMSSITSVMGQLTSSAGSTSAWMSTILEQFPELASYMGDTTTLYSKLNENLQNYSQLYVRTQYNEYMSNEANYKAQKEDWYSGLTDKEKETLDAVNATSFADVLEVIEGSSRLTDEERQALGEKLSQWQEEHDITFTNSDQTAIYEKYVDAYTDQLDAQLNNLNEQKEALQDINSQREYENKLIEAKLKLENASKEKKRVYRAGVGWVYEADQQAILEAQENLEDVENEKISSDLEKQIEILESQKDQISSLEDTINSESLQQAFAQHIEEALSGNSSFASILNDIKNGITGASEKGSTLVDEDVEDAQNGSNGIADAKESVNKTLSNAVKAANTYASSGSTTDAKTYNTNIDALYTALQSAKSAGMSDSDIDALGDTVTVNGEEMTLSQIANTSSVNSLKAVTKAEFVLPFKNGSHFGYFTGESNMETSTDASKEKDILGDIKRSNGAAIYLPNTDGYINPHDNSQWAATDEDADLSEYVSRVKSKTGKSEFVIVGHWGGDEAVYVKGGVIYQMRPTSGGDADTIGYVDGDSNGLSYKWGQNYAQGTLDLENSWNNSLINEVGTEAIVTPSGTITALPAHTGIVPADITKNLWELGEVAPSIMRTMTTQFIPDNLQQNSVTTNNDDSLNINNLSISMNADGSFNVDDFVSQLKSRVALTRHSSK